MTNHCLSEALFQYGLLQTARRKVRSYLEMLLEEAQADPRKFRLELEPTAWADDNDFDKPRLTVSLVRHNPAVSIQIEVENATPEEIRRLVPYLQSFHEPWERDKLADAGFDDVQTARDVALPYEADDTPIVLFVNGSCAGRLPSGLTYEEAVDGCLS